MGVDPEFLVRRRVGTRTAVGCLLLARTISWQYEMYLHLNRRTDRWDLRLIHGCEGCPRHEAWVRATQAPLGGISIQKESNGVQVVAPPEKVEVDVERCSVGELWGGG